MGAALDDVSEDEEFLASSKSEVFLKTFEYDIDEDIIDRVDISGDENDSVEPKITRAIPEFKSKVN